MVGCPAACQPPADRNDCPPARPMKCPDGKYLLIFYLRLIFNLCWYWHFEKQYILFQMEPVFLIRLNVYVLEIWWNAAVSILSKGMHNWWILILTLIFFRWYLCSRYGWMPCCMSALMNYILFWTTFLIIFENFLHFWSAVLVEKTTIFFKSELFIEFFEYVVRKIITWTIVWG